MLMPQYFPSHYANRANNGALMKISRQNAVAQTAVWIAINFPFCWHKEKNEHCLHVWLLHKSNLIFFHLGKLYMKERQAENYTGCWQTKDWHGSSRTPSIFSVLYCFLSIKHSSVARYSAGELEFLWLYCSVFRLALRIGKCNRPDWEYCTQESRAWFVCSFTIVYVEDLAVFFVSVCVDSFVYHQRIITLTIHHWKKTLKVLFLVQESDQSHNTSFSFILCLFPHPFLVHVCWFCSLLENSKQCTLFWPPPGLDQWNLVLN